MSDIDADQPERELAAYTRHRDDLLVRIVGVLHASTERLVATNRPLEPELAQRLPTLGERIDPLECLAVLRAQCAEVEQLHPALYALDVAIPSEMLVQVSRLARLAEAALRSR